MGKFSLYDFLSFFLPGVILCFLVYQVIPDNAHVFKSMGETIDGLVFLGIALVVGLGIHRLSFYFLNFKIYKNLIYPTVANVAKSKSFKINIDIQQIPNSSNLSLEDLFDEAYFFLEFNDKINTPKNFQSYYFFLRNLFTLSLLVLPFAIVFAYLNFNFWYLIIFISLYFLCVWFTVKVGLFYRAKMIERIFNNYKWKDFLDKK